MTFLKLVCKNIPDRADINICNDVFKDLLKHVLFDCNRNRAHVYHVKLYHFVNIEMQVCVRNLNLLTHSTNLQQTKYMLVYVNTNLIGVLKVKVLPTDLYPQFMCLNAEFFAQVCSQYAM